MFHLTAFSTIALSLAVSVSSLAVPRATPPQGWNTPLLEPYDTYHARYMALSCNTKHSTAFFDQCCHPLLATQSLATARPAQCIPATSPALPASSAPPASPASTTDDDDDDDSDLPFCDEGDDDDDDSTTPVIVPATTKAPPAVTTHPAPAVTPAAPKKVTPPAQPAVTPSTNSAGSGVNTGGFATFFYQNGVAGACGTVHKDTDMIAAIDGDRYGNLGAKSSLCGKQVKITNTQNQKTVTVTIADACPTCDNSNSIDLSTSAFKAIASLDAGIVPISWSFV